ncbi:hypothetical protein SAMN05216262_101608 [Colwellia chukchiensis]|uniref:Uncharacterized protein n=1 Tax=Colwellia chukchiensis TaxID=641665 RepID=A0A1H7HXU2_9GAMM|nr:hypothetical protein [Colwellia chukchiensis]SEK53970.1 hypothetical protein SAMN05216262_101608 [Colwellia chukchiensis]
MIYLLHARWLLLTTALLFLSGCQLTLPSESKPSYGEYYLTLQQLSSQQLADEVAKQQAAIALDKAPNTALYYQGQLKLLLLYSLPRSPVYNSFSAKTWLNNLQNSSDNGAFADISPSDQAFFSLLRDQLNQRILMRNRLLAEQQKQQQAALNQQQQLIEQVTLLQQIIKQLQNIEQAIDKRIP